MSTESIINNIVAKRNELNYAESKENHEIWDKIFKLEEQIKILAPRIEDLFKVAEALTDNGFYLGGKLSYGQSSPYFATCHIDHRVGFFLDHPYFDAPARNFTMKGYFGIANGGACGDEDLMINRQGDVMRWEFGKYASSVARLKKVRDRYLYDLQRVVDKFDEFESAFYAYAQNPISRSVRL